MDIIRQFSFLGTLEKDAILDEDPITNIQGTIYCYANGKILIDFDQQNLPSVNHKLFIEKQPLHQVKVNPSLSQAEKQINNDDFGNFKSLTTEKKEALKSLLAKYHQAYQESENSEIIRPAYKGKYKITGYEQSTKKFISAEIGTDTRNNPKFILYNLIVATLPIGDFSELYINEAKYGLTNLQLFDMIVNHFNGDKQYCIYQIRQHKSELLESNLTSEMIVTGINSEIECNNYSTWITFLLSFISGKNVDFIYQIVKGILEEQNYEVEYWRGMSQDIQKNNIAVMQKPLFSQFFDRIKLSINNDLFDDNGLGLALYWYLEKFGHGSVSTRFIFLCTALETLISSFKNNHQSYEQVSKRLLSKPCYRTIRDQVLKLVQDNKKDLQKQLRAILENNKETLDDDDLDTIINKYDLFCLKLEKSFSNFNMLGNLSETLKEMLDFYNVKYDDLFSNLDFIKIRNDITHKGFHEQDVVFSSGLKLENLFIRLVLAMLKYEGEYIEHDGNSLAYRTFPLT